MYSLKSRRLLNLVALGFLTIALLPSHGYAQVHNIDKETQSNTGKGCPPENQGADSGTNTNDPINLANGDFVEVKTDLFISGRGLDFNLRRVYRSRNGLWALHGNDDHINFQSPLGMNTDHSYNMRIEHQIAGGTPFTGRSLALYDGTGRSDHFFIDQSTTDLPTATEFAIPGTVWSLENNEYFAVVEFRGVDQEILYIQADNTVYRFHALEDGSGMPTPQSGRLKSIKDRNGNQIQIFYETVASWEEDPDWDPAPMAQNRPASRILYILDTLGNRIDFYYHDVDPQNPPEEWPPMGDPEYRHLLWKVVDHADREVIYQYAFTTETNQVMTERRLTQVVMPEIKDDSQFDLPPGHDRFNDDAGSMDRRIWTYEYTDESTEDSDSDAKYMKGQIQKVIDPNGNVVTENVYSRWIVNSSGLTPAGNRVIKQKHGGNWYYYMVTDKDGDRLNSFGAPRDYYYVWVVTRRGNVVRFKYSEEPTAPVLNTTAPAQQLLEIVEYPGVVPQEARGFRVWATVDSEGVIQSWKYLDDEDIPEIEESFMELVEKKRATDLPIVTKYSRNENWRVTNQTYPTGDKLFSVFLTGGDPRARGAMTIRTITDDETSHTITEHWEYKFNEFTGGGGCACGPDGFETAYIDGKGYVTIKEYDEGSTSTPATGNLLKVLHDLPIGTNTEPGMYSDANAMAVEEFEYNSDGQITMHKYPAKMMWDQGASIEDTHNRVDRFEYYTNSNDVGNYGRIRYSKVDTDGLFAQDLTTEYVYDRVGNVIKIIDPDGDIRKLYSNQMGELVREQSYDSAESTLFAQTDYFYDASGNLVKEEILNFDEDPDAPTNTSITAVHKYDEIDFKTHTSMERGVFSGTIAEDAQGRATPLEDTDWIVLEWDYDENRNVIEFRNGAANRGTDTENIVTYEYDFRNLLFSETRGVGSDEYRIEYDYDEKGRLELSVVNPDNPSDMQLSSQVFDGFDRRIESVDPMGNQVSMVYDDNHNLTQVSVCGPIDSDTEGADTHTLLYRVDRTYDLRDRVETDTVAVFDYLNSTPADCSTIPTGTVYSVTEYEYNNDSSLYKLNRPSADSAELFNTTTLYYDTVGRQEFAFDSAGNIQQHFYDLDSNLVSVRQTDISILASGNQVFTMAYEYDSLDRRAAMIDGVLNRTDFEFDSRSNLVGKIDARGNVTTYFYDGLGRLTESRMKMTADGDGPETDMVLDSANPSIVTSMTYDDSSRVISETDDNGQSTLYTYDGVNRRIKITMPDGEEYTNLYNANGQMFLTVDARGVILNQTFDKNNRLTDREVVPITAHLVDGALREEFTYDGLGRVLTAINYSDSAGSLPLTSIEMAYESRGFVLRETQNADGASGFPVSMDRVVNYAFDLSNNTTQILYPHGRDIQRSHDVSNRLISIKDHEPTTPMPIIDYDYVGYRPELKTNANGTQTAFTYNGYIGGQVHIDDLGFGRVSGITTTKPGMGTLDAFIFRWDASQNRTSYIDTGSGMKNRRDRAFGYDSSDRLVSTDVDFPAPNTDYTAPTNNGITDYALDGVHNRFSVTGFEEAGAPIGIYKDAAVDVPDHVKNNQYSFSPREGGGQWVYSYDENGNMITRMMLNIANMTGDYLLDGFDLLAFNVAYANQDPSADINGDGEVDFFDIAAFLNAYGTGGDLDNEQYHYDFRNQLVGVEFKTGPTTVNYSVVNTYDPFARRAVEVSDGVGGLSKKQMVYGCASLWEVIEQIQLATPTSSEFQLSTHIYGLGIDDEVAYRMETTAEDYWSHRDDLNSLTSTTDDAGVVMERYQYGDYGQVAILDPAGVERNESQYGATHLYTGRSLIAGTGLQDSRYRVLDLETGRFVQRDPLGYFDGMNLFTYTLDSPLSNYDPYGLSSDPYWPGTPDEGGHYGFVSFTVGSRDINQNVTGHVQRAVGNVFGGHTDIFYGEFLARAGFGSVAIPGQPKPAGTIDFPLKRKMNGSLWMDPDAAGPPIPCHLATDAQISECLKKFPQPTTPWTPVNNCQTDIKDAASACCLSGWNSVLSLLNDMGRSMPKKHPRYVPGIGFGIYN